MENFYWVKIQYDDDEKCRHFQAPLYCLRITRMKRKLKSSEKFPESFPSLA